MTQIELFGCTQAGKSTLASNIIRAGQEHGIAVLLSDDFVLQQARLNWIKSSLPRTLLLDLFSLSACLVTWRSNLEFNVFVFKSIQCLPIPWLEKLNLIRNILKRIGTNEIIRRRKSDQQVVLMDGGTIQAAHHLFVHVSAQTNEDDLLTFVRLVPVPDAAIYVTQSESVMIERTIQRGHKRIPNRSHAKVSVFVKKAVDTFDKLVQELMLEGKLSRIYDQPNVFVAPGYQKDPCVDMALEIIYPMLDRVSQKSSIPIYV
jgi:hypothetical protein